MSSKKESDLIFTADKINRGSMKWNDSMLNRMNQRSARIFEGTFDHVKGKSILDLGSRDGRWSWAALNLGAAFTMGIEGRLESREKGKHLFEGISLERHRCVIGNVFDVMPNLLSQGYRFDTVLCLGFFYHIYDHYGLLKMINAFQPQCIVIDSEMDDSDEPKVRLRAEKIAHPNNAISEFSNQVIYPVGNISRGGMKLLAECFNYKLYWCSWNLAEDEMLGCQDYLEQRRFTCILSR